MHNPIKVSDILDEVAIYAGSGGACRDSEKVIEHLNAAQRLLWNRGDWVGTIEYACLCVEDCCFTLPWHIEHVRKAWIGRFPIDVKNRWFEGLSWAGIQPCCGCTCGITKIVDVGKTIPLAFEWPGEDWKLRVTPLETEDEDASITFNGIDAQGVKRSEKFPLDDQRDSEDPYSNILRCYKKRTKGPIRIEAFKPKTGERMFMGFYHPEQENPNYSKYKIVQNPGCEQILIKGKRRYIPVRTEDDDLYITNIEALQHAMAAVTAQRNGDLAMKAEHMNFAEETMEEDIEDITHEPFQDMGLELAPRPQNLRPTRFGLSA